MSYLIREGDVTVHSHPLGLRSIRGIPVSVEFDDRTEQVCVHSVTIAGGEFYPDETVTFKGARVTCDEECSWVDIRPK